MLSTPRILSEHLAPLAEPLAWLLAPGTIAAPAAVAALGARTLLDLPSSEEIGERRWPGWLAPHQVPAAERLAAILGKHRGALLADAVGLGKSYVALAVALARGEPFALIVPAVLVSQWRALLKEHDAEAPIITHEGLSGSKVRLSDRPTVGLFLVDEAHRFRNPGTRRYRALARLLVDASVLLVTATPVHNGMGDICHLLRLFLRDHDLTALGVPSLLRAARGDCDRRALTAAVARLSVSRSRGRVRAGYEVGHVPIAFPIRAAGRWCRVGCAPDAVLRELVAGVARLHGGRDAAALFRLVLLSQLASSLPAFRASLGRYEAFLEQGAVAATDGKTLTRADFRRLFPAGTGDLQLVFLPLVLPPEEGLSTASARDRDLIRYLRDRSRSNFDPKAEALRELLDEGDAKTIVFVQTLATLRHLMRRLRGRRVAAVAGDRGWFGSEAASREEVIRAFAPRAQGASPPTAALATDVLIATDLLSEGVNLQDAARVIHYDLPWSPARLAQREGRIDRAASSHARIETTTFLPPEPLVAALAVERRLAVKRRAQARAGGGRDGFDWCDRLQGIATTIPAPHRSWTALDAPERAAVLVIRIGSRVEGFVGTDAGVRADPEQAAVLLERAARAERALAPTHRPFLDRMLQQVGPLCRRRLDAVEAARWRAADRDRLSRRLIPWVLSAARRAAVQRRPTELSRLDGLVSRLALGMTAGEELLLEDLVTRRTALSVGDVLAWHERLRPPLPPDDVAVPQVELVAAVVFGPA
ncbi:MAG TPA: DEAD/DEAH box helicase [Gemmatimonadales bacterium]|nr:DEAD/DEAH box helicase [Gemmatimonadales bacterium]